MYLMMSIIIMHKFQYIPRRDMHKGQNKGIGSHKKKINKSQVAIYKYSLFIK